MPLASTRSVGDVGYEFCCASAVAAIRNADSARPLTARKWKGFIALLLKALARKRPAAGSRSAGEQRARNFLSEGCGNILAQGIGLIDGFGNAGLDHVTDGNHSAQG